MGWIRILQHTHWKFHDKKFLPDLQYIFFDIYVSFVCNEL